MDDLGQHVERTCSHCGRSGQGQINGYCQACGNPDSISSVQILRQFLSQGDVDELLQFAEQHCFDPGRQGTGYTKTPIPPTHFQALRQDALRWLGVPQDTAHDCYLVKYETGSCIPLHRDDAPMAQEHHRLNAMVQMPLEGGELWVSGQPVSLNTRDCYLFRPDLDEHEVEKVLAGTRLIFTVGVLR